MNCEQHLKVVLLLPWSNQSKSYSWSCWGFWVTKNSVSLVANSVTPSLGTMTMHSSTENLSAITILNLENRMFCKWHGAILWAVALFVTHLLYDNLFKTMTAKFGTDIKKSNLRNVPSAFLSMCVHAYIHMSAHTQNYSIMFLH